MTSQTLFKFSLTGPKLLLAFPAFQRDQNRLDRSSELPEKSNFPIELHFLAKALLASLPPPCTTDHLLEPPLQLRWDLRNPLPPATRLMVAGWRRSNRLCPVASFPLALRPQFTRFLFFFILF